MNRTKFDMKNIDIAWCPGCGNFGILNALKETLEELGLEPEEVCFISGIGQAAKLPHYLKCNFFNGLHGRALPPATAIKTANPNLTVIAEGGDGDMYGEGGNHFIHAIRRNPNITNLVHNNMIYGLTKGQASPTSRMNFKTPVQVNGVILDPFNPLAVAIALDATFVARAFAGDKDKTKKILKAAINHKGYALVDIFQPCVTFNKVNTFQWFQENTYYIEDEYDPGDKIKAFEKANETEKFPLGIIFQDDTRKSFEENQYIYKDDSQPLVFRKVDRVKKIKELINNKK